MDKEIKIKWLEALRSGKYIKGRNCLRKTTVIDGITSYCCLGVLCDIVNPDAWKQRNVLTSDAVQTIVISSHLNETGLPAFEIKESCQLNIRKCQTLAHMNDDGKSFEEIAKYIEENF